MDEMDERLNKLDDRELRSLMVQVATELARAGPQNVDRTVLHEVARRLAPPNLPPGVIYRPQLAGQQRLLRTWHGLFQDGTLAYGYSIDSPGLPWFHVPPQPAKRPPAL
jgi:hypothetical protein